ncbi:hypothetical protein BDZ91DRAFT_847637 [Kalaharituber pfeilii]|nr:hypothetical protein BDZ91DRAFT_847637 [Kalaharituber pfeilii]
MPKVVWSADNDRKLLIRLIDRSAKSYDSESLARLFPGATPKAIEERIAKLKREAKALDGPGISVRASTSRSLHGKKRNGYKKRKRDEEADDEEENEEDQVKKEE